jgi:hypothetical protein
MVMAMLRGCRMVMVDGDLMVMVRAFYLLQAR